MGRISFYFWDGTYSNCVLHCEGDEQMKEYLDKEVVQEMLENAQIISNGEYYGYCTEDVRLNSISTADVADIRHGRWIPKINHTYIPVEYDENEIPVLHEYISYRCSLCGREETKEEPYCHCGARMNREDDK